MKIKNITKIILTIILAIVMLASYTSIVEARPAPEDTMKPSSSSSASAGTINPQDYKPSELTASDTAVAFRQGGTIVKAFIYVGMVISIVMFMALGLKYMMGSVEERADYKKTLVPMLIGTLMIFISGTVVSIIWSIMEKVNV